MAQNTLLWVEAGAHAMRKKGQSATAIGGQVAKNEVPEMIALLDGLLGVVFLSE
jgi:hypothetical protein